MRPGKRLLGDVFRVACPERRAPAGAVSTVGVRDANAETDEAAVHLKDITHKLSGISSELGEATEQFLVDMRAG